MKDYIEYAIQGRLSQKEYPFIIFDKKVKMHMQEAPVFTIFSWLCPQLSLVIPGTEENFSELD